MGIYFSPAAGVTLTNWSFENGKILAGPAWRDERPTYYIFYSHGLSPSSWEFWEDDAQSVVSGGTQSNVLQFLGGFGKRLNLTHHLMQCFSPDIFLFLLTFKRVLSDINGINFYTG